MERAHPKQHLSGAFYKMERERERKYVFVFVTCRELANAKILSGFRNASLSLSLLCVHARQMKATDMTTKTQFIECYRL